MKKLLLLTLIFFTLNSCFLEDKSDFEAGNLWKMTLKNGKESYIFGTVHLYPKNELEIPELVVAKLKECEMLALERDITDKSEQQKFMDFEMPAYFTENYKALINEYGNELVSMESQLIRIANENRIKISGLESTDEILDIMTDLAKIEIPKTDFQKDKIIQVYEQTLGMYKSEQIRSFKDSLQSQMPRAVTELTVDKRNKNWLGDIINLVEKQPTFIAVGMGHLGGDGGLLSLLAEKGYKLNAVDIKNTSPNKVYN
nr:TraB/GumN family protein [uncultured Allomuricauda sp.]